MIRRIVFWLALLTLTGCVSLSLPADLSGVLSSPSSPSSSSPPRKLGYVGPSAYAGDFVVAPTQTGALTFAASTTPVISQSQSTTGAGVTTSITAQAAKAGSAAAGGDLQLQGGSGDGAGSHGGVIIPGYAQLKLGTQDGSALGSSVASTGHLRTPNGFKWLQRNAANTADYVVVANEGGANDISIGAGTSNLRIGYSVADGLRSAQTFIDASTNIFLGFNQSVPVIVWGRPSTTLNETTLTIADGTGGTVATWSNASTGSSSLTWATGVTPTITQATASAAPHNFFIQAQAAGGTNDGAQLQLAGGLPAGTGTVFGSTVIATPLNAGELTFTPVNGAQTLTGPQSNPNFLVLASGATAAFTITVSRRVADTSLYCVRNNTTQTATIQYLTGGSVTVSAGTSALLVSDGTNLVKILSGT